MRTRRYVMAVVALAALFAACGRGGPECLRQPNAGTAATGTTGTPPGVVDPDGGSITTGTTGSTGSGASTGDHP